MHWLHCPKHFMATKRKVDFAAAVATMEYNHGYVASNLCGPLGLPYTAILDKILKKDKRMNRQLVKKMRNKHLQRELFYSAGNF